MPSIHSLLALLKADYPHLSFQTGSDFHWDHSSQTITYKDAGADPHGPAQLLHEVAHGLLEHQGYTRDIELIGKERDAWSYAVTQLAPHYDVVIDNDIITTTMDSYRDWLHARSTCPKCQATGVETAKQYYSCPACRHRWRVNEARICGLKRYSQLK